MCVCVCVCLIRYGGMIDGGGNCQFRFLKRRAGRMVRLLRENSPFQLAQEMIHVCTSVGMDFGGKKDDVGLSGRFVWDGKVICLCVCVFVCKCLENEEIWVWK